MEKVEVSLKEYAEKYRSKYDLYWMLTNERKSTQTSQFTTRCSWFRSMGLSIQAQV